MSTMYRLETLPIFKDIREIIGKGVRGNLYEFKASIHTETDDLNIFKVLSLDIVRDYKDNIGDLIQITVSIANIDFVRKIYPRADNLELTLKVTSPKNSIYEDTEDRIKEERYKAVLDHKTLGNPLSAEANLFSDGWLEGSGFTVIKLQLVNRIIEPVRIKTGGGIFSNILPRDILGGYIPSNINQIRVDGNPILDGFDIIPPNNQSKVPHLVIPSNTKLVDIPDILQNEICGIYNFGLGSYIQKYNGLNTWFIYPLCDPEIYTKSKGKKVIFYKADTRLMPDSDITYFEDGDLIKALITSSVDYQNSLENSYLNTGSGFRMPDANAMMGKAAELEPGAPSGSRSRLNTEVVVKSRKDNINYAPRIKGGISSNPFKQYSDVEKNSASLITFEWRHSPFDAIYPGMPAKYVFMLNDEIKELTGNILHAHSLTSLQGEMFTSFNHTTTTAVTMVVDKSLNSLLYNEEILP